MRLICKAHRPCYRESNWAFIILLVLIGMRNTEASVMLSLPPSPRHLGADAWETPPPPSGSAASPGSVSCARAQGASRPTPTATPAVSRPCDSFWQALGQEKSAPLSVFWLAGTVRWSPCSSGPAPARARQTASRVTSDPSRSLNPL